MDAPDGHGVDDEPMGTPLDRFTRSGVPWFRGITMRLAGELIELGIAESRGRGEPVEEELATADMLFDSERRRRRSVREYAERWGWSKSAAHRLMQRYGVGSDEPARRGRDAPDRTGQPGTQVGRPGTTDASDGTGGERRGTQPAENEPFCNNSGTLPEPGGTGVGHLRESQGQVRDSPYSESRYQNTEEYPLPPPRTCEEVAAFGLTAGVPEDYCAYFFSHYAPAWCDRDGRAIDDWPQRLLRWWRKDAQHWSAWSDPHGRHERRTNDTAEARAARAAEAATGGRATGAKASGAGTAGLGDSGSSPGRGMAEG